MEMKQSYISDTYHILYLTFSKEKMNEIFDEVKYDNDVSDYKKEEEPEYLERLVMLELNEQIKEVLTKIDVMPIGKPIIKFMKKVKENTPLLVIVKTCVLPIDLNLHFPIDFNIQPNNYKIIEDKNVKRIINNILLHNYEFEMVNRNKVTQKSIVYFDISFSQDNVIFDKIDNQKVEMDNKDNDFDYSNLLNHVVNDEVVISDGNIMATAKITKIYERKINELTDQVVLRLNFAETSTVNDFIKKLKEVLIYKNSIETYSKYIIEYVVTNHDFELDDNMKRHYLSFAHKEKDKEYLKNIQKDLIAEAIGSLVSLNYEDKHVRTFKTLSEVFDLELLLQDIDEDETEEVFKHFENNVWIVQFFVDQEIIKLDI